MQPRQEIIEQFSTFLQFANDRLTGWAIDARLQRSMQTRMAKLQTQSCSEAFWALYWHQRWLEAQNHQDSPDALAQFHLSAYLQEAGYWAAQTLMQRVIKSSSTVCDCFQLAIEKVPKVLQACDPNHKVSLKTYSKVAFENIIRDALRQQHEVNLCNEWALLLKISRKQLQEALQQAGLNQQAIAPYLIAYQCYTEGYRLLKLGRRIQRPDAAGWHVLVQLYHNHYPKASIDAADLEHQLLYSAQQVRAYLYPIVTSLNAPKFEQTEWQDDIPDRQATPIAHLIQQEEQTIRRSQQTQLNEILSTALLQLDVQAQTLLALYYQQNLTQQQIAQELNVQQYTVSRRLSKARELLLLALMRWSQSALHIEPTSTVIKSISALLEEWLQSYYARSMPTPIPELM